jgi:ABC-2 type transport system ATP-binding protein
MNGQPNHSAVVLDRLEKRFGDFIAVNGISLEVRRGEVFGFLGPNGAGKSTTIRMLCGILAPSGGRGTVAGFEIGTEAEKIKANIGYMSQKFSLYEDLTVQENIDFYGGIYGLDSKRLAERKEWVLRMAGLTERRDALTSILPTGWRQRLSLGCAVLHAPPIVFLDEPTSGVDPISRRHFWDLIYSLSDGGTTVFVTTHYMEEAEYCERLGLIYHGDLVAIGTPAELKEKLMTEAVIEVRVARPFEALDALAGVDAVKEVALFGRGLHVVTDAPDRAATAIRARLDEVGIAADSVERIVPSLEDVFVSLIEARDRERGPAVEVKK